jgi:hypothetical protein
MNMTRLRTTAFSLTLLVASFATAGPDEDLAEVDALVAEVADLERELAAVEAELLHPASTRVSVFVTANDGPEGRLDTVVLSLNGHEVARHSYDERERAALSRGGSHRLLTTDVEPGTARLEASFTGSRTDGKPWRRSVDVELEQAFEPTVVELRLLVGGRRGEPEIVARVSQ